VGNVIGSMPLGLLERRPLMRDRSPCVYGLGIFDVTI
jgi:hypothetical protein